MKRLLALTLFVVTLGILTETIVQGEEHINALEREIEYQKIMTRQLGKYLKEKYAGKKAIIIKAPYYKEDFPYWVGLMEGLGGAITIVDTVCPEPPNASSNMAKMPPPETWYTKAVLERLLRGKEADLVITLIGLPMDLLCTGKEFNANCLKNKKIVFAGGSIYEHGRGFAMECIAAGVTYKPNPEYDDRPIPKDLQAAFDRRYLLVTSENFKEIIRKYPDRFQH